ncbi:LOW QUALITY PROTEIN: hypothetical protein OSB04_023595 [Centaurea solstitialis]|uniref:Uncharacterized protein n=1 Tax=Centaurea solstitialis TaxID=347529 RepID=A0AA38SS13_9ASTR|nr:LOW QUALITY PROTEIN: hypothetical protein OSB04_023595 [Centaurea solstitialis]
MSQNHKSFRKEQIVALEKILNNTLQDQSMDKVKTAMVAHKNAFAIRVMQTNSQVIGIGTVISKDIVLNSVLYVPTLNYNLLSISKNLKYSTKFLVEPQLKPQFLSSEKNIGNTEVQAVYIFLKPVHPQSLFFVRVSSFASLIPTTCDYKKSALINFCHNASSSLSKQALVTVSSLDKNAMFSNVKHVNSHNTWNSYILIPYKASNLLYLIHWGPTRIKNLSRTWWFVTFIDDHTHVTWLFLMKEKFEVEPIFKRFHTMIQNQSSAEVHIENRQCKRI